MCAYITRSRPLLGCARPAPRRHTPATHKAPSGQYSAWEGGVQVRACLFSFVLNAPDHGTPLLRVGCAPRRVANHGTLALVAGPHRVRHHPPQSAGVPSPTPLGRAGGYFAFCVRGSDGRLRALLRAQMVRSYKTTRVSGAPGINRPTRPGGL